MNDRYHYQWQTKMQIYLQGSDTISNSHSPRHGGLYRWRGNLFPFLLYQKLKEILIRYSRIILTASKRRLISKIQNLKGVVQKLRPPCPFEFWSIDRRQGVNFGANDFSFWLNLTSIRPELQSQNCV